MRLRNFKLFGLPGFLLVLLGVICHVFLSESAFDIQLHDTYFVIAYYHIFYLTGLILVGIAAMYYLSEKVVGRYLNKTLSIIHFVTTILTLPLLAIIFMYKRVFTSLDLNSNPGTNKFELLAFVVAAHIPFIINLIYSFWKGEKV